MGTEVFRQLGGDPGPALRHVIGVLQLQSHPMLTMPVHQPDQVFRPIVSLNIREANSTLSFKEMEKLELETGFLMEPHKFLLA